MNFDEIKKLMKMLEESSLSYLEVEENGVRICLDKNSNEKREEKGISSTPIEEKKEEVGNFVTAPLVGTFHMAPYKGAKPFVSLGDKVKKGQKLCIIEAMKVMNEITSPYDGSIKEICVVENDIVDFGKKLFVVEA
jgi:acetyl-CoA carboxylase biotin carboxyl carrier protein